MRYHNRLANGSALEVMEKMLSLVKIGLLDVTVGPGGQIEIPIDRPNIYLRGPVTGARIHVDTLIDAKLHDLNIRRDSSPLYQNLLKRGFIKPWVNKGGNTAPYEPGGIDLTKSFHPVNWNGRIDERLTFLGPASEGFVFFQVGAARPNQNHHVLNDLIEWSNELERKLVS